jgi:hypothetical protein
MQSRGLTRKQAKELHSLGLPVESRHKWRRDDCWGPWDLIGIYTDRFDCDATFIDEFRVKVEE